MKKDLITESYLNIIFEAAKTSKRGHVGDITIDIDRDEKPELYRGLSEIVNELNSKKSRIKNIQDFIDKFLVPLNTSLHNMSETRDDEHADDEHADDEHADHEHEHEAGSDSGDDDEEEDDDDEIDDE